MSADILDISSLVAVLQTNLARRSFGVQRRANFYADLASFVSEGITPYAAIERMISVAAPRRSMRWQVRILGPVAQLIRNGERLGVAMGGAVPAEEAGLLLAGEQNGSLMETLTELASLLQTKALIRSTLRSQLGPAAANMLVLVGLMVVILNTVIKEARSMLSDEMLSKLVLAPAYFTYGQLLLDSLPFLLIIGIALTIAISATMSSWKPVGARAWLDTHIPPYTLFGRVQASFFLATVASIMKAGGTFASAVAQIRGTASPWMKTHVARIQRRLEDGQSSVEAMATGLLPWDVSDRLTIYEMLGDLSRIMLVTSRDSMQMLIKRVTFIGAVARTASMLALALFILATIFSIGEIAVEAQSSVDSLKQ